MLYQNDQNSGFGTQSYSNSTSYSSAHLYATLQMDSISQCSTVSYKIQSTDEGHMVLPSPSVTSRRPSLIFSTRLDLQNLDSWLSYFGNPENSSRIGIFTAGTRIGQLAGLPLISPIVRKYGCRMPIIYGSAVMLIGIALQASATSTAQFVVGRVILGFSNNIQQCGSLILISELAYPDHRPKITAIMNSTGSIGFILGAWITYGTSFLQPSEWSWRLPSLLQAVSSIFQIIMTIFVPESPRWLITNHREDEARRILVKYHAEGDENSELVQFEMAEMAYTLELDKKKRLNWGEWFRTSANRHRLFVVVTLSFLIQWCGNAIISYYIGLMLSSFGIENTSTKLLINGGLTLWGLGWAITFSLSIEYVGRRKLFLTAMAGMFVVWTTLTALAGVNQTHDNEDTPLSVASVVMVFLHVAFYKMAAPIQDPYFMEISPYGLRAKTAVIKSFGDASANLFSAFVNPIGIEQIGWKYYITWGKRFFCVPLTITDHRS